MKHLNGVYDTPIEEYHGSNAISRSSLIYFQKSPYHYWFNKQNKSIKKPTEAMIFGNLVHTLCLESDKFYERYAIAPEVDRRKKEGKDIYSEFIKNLGNREVITLGQYNEALNLKSSVMRDEMARSLVSGMEVEKSIFFTHEPTGFQCKVRPDCWNGQGLVVDLKTAKDGSDSAFQRDAVYNGYFLQAGMIQQALASIGITLDKFVFVVIEKTEPYALGIYIVDDEALADGINLFHTLMEGVAECELKNKWESYGVQTLSLPTWAKSLWR